MIKFSIKSIGYTILAASILSANAQTTDRVDADYLAFINARGEASWINANADHALSNEAFRPIPSLEQFPADTQKRNLGFELFHDTSLSSDRSVACSSCHSGMMAGADGRSLPRGIGGALGERNTPTIFNAAFNFRQFWDGRAFDLETQAIAPLSNPLEMGHDLDLILTRLKDNENYATQFAEIYPDGLTAKNLGNAISQHTKDMTRTDSSFNASLTDSSAVLPESVQRGQQRFTELGCASCHNGINLGGNSYQAIASNAQFLETLETKQDLGLYSRTGRDSDKRVFKVPQLHNVALTAPYFHDGSVATLKEAIVLMAQNQAGRTLNAGDVDDISAFLNSLSSEFFGGRGRGMNQQQMRNSMRQQMPDMMQQHSGQSAMRGGNHQQHMMQMRSMQDQSTDQNADNAEHSQHEEH